MSSLNIFLNFPMCFQQHQLCPICLLSSWNLYRRVNFKTYMLLCLEWIFLHWGSQSKFHNQFLGKCGSTQVGGCTPVRTPNWFLCRNWWRGITQLVERSQVTTHICCVLGWPDGCRKVIMTATTAFIPNIDLVMSYGRVKSPPLVMGWANQRV
jgi:hypothetical protein